MACPEQNTTITTSTARDQFIKNIRRDLISHSTGSKHESKKSCGSLVAQATRFNSSLDRITGSTLISKDERDWLWEVRGDPDLIDRRLGGHAKRPRDKAFCEDLDDTIVANISEHDSQTTVTPRVAAAEADSFNPLEAPATTKIILNAKQTAKRIRTLSSPTTIMLSSLSGESLQSGPSGNTRSRTKKVLTGLDQVAEMTAAMDGFSVYSGHHTDIELPNGLIDQAPASQKPKSEMVTNVWAESGGSAANVGIWLGTLRDHPIFHLSVQADS
ncbi:uncharacterized protein MELLADRAFT_66217 [Melampsora larici-populina 98AG31]|uniref:Uncharacterized protein n=1 Tax=Melampsora larici-populina (strain 98AG31 / pathotype 3-4-7) TaxID=747676 RepID=F4RYA7_MELLP|nr:uncharacterized protein MELLADRAFT_66217 [Melampsora larici-populina 98AG31]EGG02669.1 hypothetical protein MELLADRAFT_66217 [Melampsora larici-populina 98AG31]